MATVSSLTRFTTVTLASNSAGPFNVGFRIFETDSLTVYVDGETRVDWTLTSTLTDNPGGYDDAATITFDDDLPSETVIWIEGTHVPEREDDYSATEPRLTDKLNAELPRLWTPMNEAQDRTLKSLRATTRVPPLDLSAADDVVLKWKDNRFQTGPSVTNIEAAAGYAAEAAAYATYTSRAAFIAAEVPATVMRIAFMDFGMSIPLVRDATGTAVTQADGTKWAPDGPNMLEAYGPARDGVTDDTAVIQRAVDFAPSLYVAGGQYMVKSRIQNDDLEGIWSDNPVKPLFIYEPTVLDEGMFLVEPGGPGPGRGARELLTADTNYQDNTITVADGTTFEAGEFIELRSWNLAEDDSQAGEYWCGVDGQGGYGVRCKGEYAQIESIDGNDLRLTERLEFGYDATNYAVRVSKFSFFQRFEARGVRFKGPGNTGGTSTDQNIGNCFDFYNLTGVNFTGCFFSNFGDNAVQVGCCFDAVMHNCFIYGPDLALADNVPQQVPKWAKGLVANGCKNVSFTNNKCRHLRRGVDAQTFTSTVPTFHVINSNNHFENCKEAVGGHQCRYYTAEGNTGSVDSFGALRCEHATITSNDVTMWGRDVALYIGLAPPDEAHSEESPVGNVTLIGNVVNGRELLAGVNVRAGLLSSLTAHGNKWGYIRGGAAYEFNCKRIRNVKIDDVVEAIAIDEGDGTESALVVVNHPNVPLEELDGFEVRLRCEGGFAYGPQIPGTESGVGAKGVSVDISMESCVNWPLSFQHITGQPTERDGNWAEPPRVRGFHVSTTPTGTICQPPATGGPAPLWNPPILGGAPLGPVRVFYPDVSSQANYSSANRTYLAGSRVEFDDAPGYAYVTASGTAGSLVGRTVSITATEDTFDMDGGDPIYVGSHVTIAGAGAASADLDAVVIAKNGDTYTIDTTASTTVSGAALSYKNPTFSVLTPENEWEFTDVADDAAVSFDLPGSGAGRQFILAVNTNLDNGHGIVLVRVTNAQSKTLAVDSALEVTTGALGGTDGTDDKLTVSPHSDGKVYIENRMGSAADITVAILSSVNI